MVRILLAALMTVIAILFGQMGWSWIEQGHGLHPAVAYPIATSAVWVIGLMCFAVYLRGKE